MDIFDSFNDPSNMEKAMQVWSLFAPKKNNMISNIINNSIKDSIANMDPMNWHKSVKSGEGPDWDALVSLVQFRS